MKTRVGAQACRFRIIGWIIALSLTFGLLEKSSAGDALADLRVRLEKIKPTTSFKARIEVRSTSSEDDGEQSKIERRATIDAIHDRIGIHLSWTAPELEKARQQKAQKQREPNSAKSEGLASFDAGLAHELLDAAPDVLLALEGATIVQNRIDTFDNKPATLIQLNLRTPIADKDKKHVKKFESTARLWIDQDGWPLALETHQYLKASMMLISFVVDTVEKRRFGHTTDRVFVSSSARETSNQGLGQKGGERTTIKLVPVSFVAPTPSTSGK